MATHGFQQILKRAEFFHKSLRLSLACLERQGMQQGEKQMHASKLPQKPKIRIIAV
jgi:hypothetical protein